MHHRLVVAGIVAAIAMPASAASTLHQAFERAVARNAEVQGLQARTEEARARAAAARSFTPAPPALIVGARRENPLIDPRRGAAEYEAELEIPFWLPGQKAAAGVSAQALEGSFRLGADAVAWTVAGAVREQVWVTALEAAELAVTRRRVDTALAIEADVARRLKGGEVARGDLLQAQGEALAARIALAEVELRYRQSLTAWTALTGLDALPDSFEEIAAATGELDGHPRLVAANASVAAARADVQLAQSFRRDPPSVSLQNRADRDVATGDSFHTLRLNLRVPFATDARNRPRIAGAQATLTQAMVSEQRERAYAVADLQAAQLALATARTQFDLAQARDTTSRDALRLARRGFTLGEAPFVVVLLALTRAVDSELAFARADIGVKRAIARLNQAAGVLP
ncbi:MAG: TolC family protein [Burkholderiales bacterium]|nr:TolC family protein [Burkholderiales bacterium]